MTTPLRRHSPAAESVDDFVDRVLDAAAGTFRIFTMYVGHRLGYYGYLASGARTSRELADLAGTHERYAREWLEQQTVAGVLEVEEPDAPMESRRYWLPATRAEALTNSESLDYVAPLVQLLVGATSPVRRVVDAHRDGGGIPYADFGDDLIEGQAAMNRAMFLRLIPNEWIPKGLPDVHERLSREPPARVADVGCGAGWSSIGIAEGYPNARVTGIDLDDASIRLARENAATRGVADRVDFILKDAAAADLQGGFDLVAAFECIHDMARPVEALRAMRGLVADDGAVLVVDERVGERFTTAGTDLEWMMYGWSVLHCLPAGMAEQPSAATGTVMRPATLARYAEEAGFSGVDVLDVDNPFFRLYRLHR